MVVLFLCYWQRPKAQNQFVHYFLILIIFSLFIFSSGKLNLIARINCQGLRNKVLIEPTASIRAFIFLSDLSRYSFFSPPAEFNRLNAERLCTDRSTNFSKIT